MNTTKSGYLSNDAMNGATSIANPSQLVLAIDACVGAIGDDGKLNIGCAPIDYTCCCGCADCCSCVGRYARLARLLTETYAKGKEYVSDLRRQIETKGSPLSSKILNKRARTYMEFVINTLETIGNELKAWIDKNIPEEDKFSQYGPDPSCCKRTLCGPGPSCCHGMVQCCSLLVCSCCQKCNSSCYDSWTCSADYGKHAGKARAELLQFCQWHNTFSLGQYADVGSRKGLGGIVANTSIRSAFVRGQWSAAFEKLRELNDGKTEIDINTIRSLPSANGATAHCKELIRSYGEDNAMRAIRFMCHQVGFETSEVAIERYFEAGELWEEDRIPIAKNLCEIWFNKLTPNPETSVIRSFSDKARARRKCASSCVLCCFLWLLLLIGLGAIVYGIVNQIV